MLSVRVDPTNVGVGLPPEFTLPFHTEKSAATDQDQAPTPDRFRRLPTGMKPTNTWAREHFGQWGEDLRPDTQLAWAQYVKNPKTLDTVARGEWTGPTPEKLTLEKMLKGYLRHREPGETFQRFTGRCDLNTLQAIFTNDE